MTPEQDFPATDDMIVTVAKNAFSLIGLRISREAGIVSFNVGEGTPFHCGVDIKDKGTLPFEGIVIPALSVLRDQVVRTALSHKE